VYIPSNTHLHDPPFRYVTLREEYQRPLPRLRTMPQKKNTRGPVYVLRSGNPNAPIVFFTDSPTQ